MGSASELMIDQHNTDLEAALKEQKAKEKLINEYNSYIDAENIRPKPKEEKKGILNKIFKKPRRILSNYELQDFIIYQAIKSQGEIDFLKEAMLKEVSALNDLANAIKKMQEKTKEKDTDKLLIEQIRRHCPGITAKDGEILNIVNAYIATPNKYKDGIEQEIYREMQETGAEDVPHPEYCYKCDANLTDGEYYITKEGLKGCLKHLEEDKEAYPITHEREEKKPIKRKPVKKRVVKDADKENNIL